MFKVKCEDDAWVRVGGVDPKVDFVNARAKKIFLSVRF
jgi:hypothetical protein